MTQTVFTVVTEVDAAKINRLLAVLNEISADPSGNAVLPFARFDTLHFASMVFAHDAALPPTLIFESNVDGSVDLWLKAVITQARTGLDAVYSQCVGYPVEGDDEQVQTYLSQHVVRPAVYHVGATGRSLARIRQEAAFRAAIEDHVDRQLADGTLPSDPRRVRSSIQAFVRAHPEFSWANTSQPRETKLARFRAIARLVAFIVVASVLVVLVLWPAVIVWLILLRMKEARDQVQEGPANPAIVEAALKNEDFTAQNHLATVIPIKPGLVRAVTLRVVLYVLSLFAGVIGTKGSLAGITSIHFAHWSIVNHGKHLLFLSNFDGSWQSYLGDFVDFAAPRLTAVWSNTMYFPRTRFLMSGGAADGPRFLQWSRAQQRPTNVWYSAYPESTMLVIDNNSSIREGLYRSMRKSNIQKWLRRL